MNYFRAETLSHGNIQMLLEMRYMTIFDNIRDEACKQLLNAWHIFAKQGVNQEMLQIRPYKVYDINLEDFSINWLGLNQLKEMRQKSLYQRASTLMSPKAVTVPKEE